ncbi:MAG: KH domain-containing protein, partial [Clostridiales bacterium]|nr:KH domain-containing protein [Candidatus Apopatousia equi]
MKVFEFEGKNVQKVIKEGLESLGKNEFDLDVDIKILDSGSLFKKAKVQITIDDGEDEKKETPKVVEAEKVEEKVETPVVEEVAPVEEKEEVVAEEPVVAEEKVEETNEEPKEEPAVKVHITDYEDGHDVHEEVEKKEKVRVYENNKGSKAFLEGLLKSLNIEGTVELEEREENTFITISCDKAGALIGHKGEALSSLQYITNMVEQRENRNAKRVIVDIAGYRENRDDSLKDLADRMARKVLKTRKSVKLNYMNAYERRIVHSYLQNFEGVSTHSEGVEPKRFLIIDIK